MSDPFSPEIRASAMWSGDSRLIARGQADQVVLRKLGKVAQEDLSEREEVAMGKVMQPHIAGIYSDRHGVRLKYLDDNVVATHLKYEWLKSHGDYQIDNGDPKAPLIEIKNYNANMLQYFGDDSDENPRIPPADYAQCLHEAICFGVDQVTLVVLFGGQRLREYCLKFTDAQKEEWIQTLAAVWANVQTNTMPPPSTPEAARAIWPVSTDDEIVATAAVAQLADQLRQYVDQIKTLEDYADAARAHLQNYMRDKSTLVTPDGKILATWKTSKGSKRFDAKAFETAMPDVYKQFVREVSGSRRFLIK